jgi:hypothetical protein
MPNVRSNPPSVDQDVERLTELEEARCTRAHGAELGEIEREVGGTSARAADFFEHVMVTLFRTPRQKERGSGVSQSYRRGSADTGVGSGDED